MGASCHLLLGPPKSFGVRANYPQTPPLYPTTWVSNFRQSSMLRTHQHATYPTHPLQPGTRLPTLNRSVAHSVIWSMLTSPQPNAPFPSLNQGFGDNRLSIDAGSHFDSRRSSVDSRMNVGMGHLQISPASPYDSQNTSRVSLVSNLQQQRGITNHDARINGASPLSPPIRNSGIRANHPPRRAPVINPNPRSVSGMPDPMAAAPTKGYAWAFPAEFEPEERRHSSSGESSAGNSHIPSRQNSFATSINSSIYTTDSQLPSGQKRLDNGMHTRSWMKCKC